MTSTLDDARGELLALADEIEAQSEPVLLDMLLSKKERSLIVAALRAAPVPQCGEEPVAWIYESWLGERSWSKHFSFDKPTGNKWQRNIVPLYAFPSPSEGASAIRWQRVNGEPFEYAIQQGQHGDEFVKLLDETCLRRAAPVTQCDADTKVVRHRPLGSQNWSYDPLPTFSIEVETVERCDAESAPVSWQAAVESFIEHLRPVQRVFNSDGTVQASWSVDGRKWFTLDFTEALRILESAVSPPSEAGRDKALAAFRQNLQEAWAAMAMIRETIETLGPVGAVKASEHLDGPTFMHEAEALVAGIMALSPDQGTVAVASAEIAEGIEVLRDLEVAWLTAHLSDSIANLGYPVGMGMAPHPEQIKKAATTLFERYAKMIAMARGVAHPSADRKRPDDDWTGLRADGDPISSTPHSGGGQ